MDGQHLHYFAGGNTAKGFHHLFDSNVKGLEHVFILSGKSDREKSALIGRLGDEWSGRGFALENIHRAHDPGRLEGLLIRELGVGIVDGDPPRILHKEFMGSHWETIDLETASRTAQLEHRSSAIRQLLKKIEEADGKAYAAYAEGLAVHDEWESIYIGRMDFEKADAVTKDLIARLFPARSKEEERTVVRRFLGAATPDGPVDFVNNITAGLAKRILLKGRAGTGKSTLLKKVVSEAEKLGFSIEIYHCGFDPASLDMVIVRELGWAVFDSTKPHEYFPETPGDEVLDMYELTVAPGTDELFAEEIAEIEARYREKMQEGKLFLAEGRRLRSTLEDLYAEAAGRDRLEETYEEINAAFSQYAKNYPS